MTAFDIANWMSLVEGTKRLSELSIPGTHDTCARYGGPLFVTQSRTVREQLDAGIRFLDIRCRHIENVFAIHHDLVFEHTYFGDVQNTCLAFLREHPRETIIISVKEEYDPSKNTETFEQTFDRYIQPHLAQYAGLGEGHLAVAMAGTPKGDGLWILSPNGAVHTRGKAVHYGDGVGNDRTAVAILGAPDGKGYWILSARGNIYRYGSAPYLGGGGANGTAVGLAFAVSTVPSTR